MKLFKRYPVTAALLIFFVSSCAFAYCTLTFKTVTIVALAVTVASILLFCRISKTPAVLHSFKKELILVLVSVILSSLLSAYAFDYSYNSMKSLDGTSDNVRLKITDCTYSMPYMTEYTAVVENSAYLPHEATIALTSYAPCVENGTVLSGEITYYSLSGKTTSSFDGERYYLSNKILISAEDVSLQQTGETGSLGINGFFSSVNSKLSSYFLANCDRDAGRLASTVFLGNKSLVPDMASRDFRRLGISHLLVVSGTHFSVIISFISYLLSKLKTKRTLRVVVTVGVIVFFMFLTGCTPSVVRAGIMHLLAQISLLVYRKANHVNSYAISGVLLVIVNPYCVLDCGLQLSYAATFSCFLYMATRSSLVSRIKHTAEQHNIGRFFVKLILTVVEMTILTTFVTVVTLPLAWIYFGELSMLSVPANILFIPLISVYMFLGCAYLILYPIRIFIYPCALLVNGMSSLILKLADSLSTAGEVMIPVNYSFSVYFIIPLVILCVLFPFVVKRARIAVVSSAAAVLVSFFVIIACVTRADYDRTYINYIADGKNDGFVIKTDNKSIICDVSNGSLSYLNSLCDSAFDMHCCEIDALVLTHYHNKHAQSFRRLCENEILHSVVLPVPCSDSEVGIFNELCEIAEIYGVRVVSDTLSDYRNVAIKVYDRVMLKRSTHPITAVKISAYDSTVAYLSSSFNEGSEEMLSCAESADFIVFGRHSPVYKKYFSLSYTDVPMAFVISADAYNHMNTDLLDYIKNKNALVDKDTFSIVFN